MTLTFLGQYQQEDNLRKDSDNLIIRSTYINTMTLFVFAVALFEISFLPDKTWSKFVCYANCIPCQFQFNVSFIYLPINWLLRIHLYYVSIVYQVFHTLLRFNNSHSHIIYSFWRHIEAVPFMKSSNLCAPYLTCYGDYVDLAPKSFLILIGHRAEHRSNNKIEITHIYGALQRGSKWQTADSFCRFPHRQGCHFFYFSKHNHLFWDIHKL